MTTNAGRRKPKLTTWEGPGRRGPPRLKSTKYVSELYRYRMTPSDCTMSSARCRCRLCCRSSVCPQPKCMHPTSVRRRRPFVDDERSATNVRRRRMFVNHERLSSTNVRRRQMFVVDERSSSTNVRRRETFVVDDRSCLLYTSPSPRDATLSRMPSSA